MTGPAPDPLYGEGGCTGRGPSGIEDRSRGGQERCGEGWELRSAQIARPVTPRNDVSRRRPAGESVFAGVDECALRLSLLLEL
jgi:hypothetical protein